MNKTILLGTILATYFAAPLVHSTSLAWELEKDKNGVQVFTRSKPESLLKEFKGTIKINAGQEVLLSAFKNIENYDQWMPDVVETKVIEMTDNQHQHYVKLDMPWPVTDRDGVYQFTYETTTAGSTRISVIATPDKEEIHQKSIRIPYATGLWLLDYVDDQVTQVTYQMHADPGGSLPAWLINSSVVDTPYNTLVNLKAYIENGTHK